LIDGIARPGARAARTQATVGISYTFPVSVRLKNLTGHYLFDFSDKNFSWPKDGWTGIKADFPATYGAAMKSKIPQALLMAATILASTPNV
jgi:hypothetical protein